MQANGLWHIGPRHPGHNMEHVHRAGLAGARLEHKYQAAMDVLLLYTLCVLPIPRAMTQRTRGKTRSFFVARSGKNATKKNGTFHLSSCLRHKGRRNAVQHAPAARTEINTRFGEETKGSLQAASGANHRRKERE